MKIVSIRQFQKELKSLHKRYKQLGKDIQQLHNELNGNPKAGVPLANNCYKIRLANSSMPTGKSGGFRVVYYYIDDDGTIYLLSIYSKNDIATISDEKIVEILKREGIVK
ncbi:type II toxin-antitoxin system RelE/ParE family toxin [Sulfurovum sp.]|uniref:type II toxin-antitoxin system RelE family toxin n=1 Tax=Sulfurovum sp. TaxID=1969726 RepID=UPI0025ECCE1B|nr:type II toxin-antitoxin system RelE/ParE family toxin [Sulfurovum sp.]